MRAPQGGPAACFVPPSEAHTLSCFMAWHSVRTSSALAWHECSALVSCCRHVDTCICACTKAVATSPLSRACMHQGAFDTLTCCAAGCAGRAPSQRDGSGAQAARGVLRAGGALPCCGPLRGCIGGTAGVAPAALCHYSRALPLQAARLLPAHLPGTAACHRQGPLSPALWPHPVWAPGRGRAPACMRCHLST